MYFASLAGEVPGDDEQEVRDFIRTWAHDFEPDMRTSRLVKFMRADAINRDHIYEPDSWRLDNPARFSVLDNIYLKLLSTIVGL